VSDVKEILALTAKRYVEGDEDEKDEGFDDMRGMVSNF
jgi:hypothetical protein